VKILISRGMPTALLALLGAGIVVASEIEQKIAQAQLRNAEQLRQYTWKMRTEVQQGGETKNVQLALMRYDMYGALQKTPMSSTPPPPPAGRGLRGRIVEKKRDDVKDTLSRLQALAASYGDLPPSKMQRFMATATVAPEIGVQRSWLRATGSDLLERGDSMTLWVDTSTHKMRKVEVRTTLDRMPVRVVSEFQDLADGPTYAGRSVIEYPSERLTVIAENFDYQRAGK
jgi:hypothetical protein